MKTIPTVQRYMSTSPYTVGAEQSLATARAMMREHEIRHLPVMHGNRLVGIVSDGDIQVIAGLQGADLGKMTVEDAMTQDVLTFEPETPLDTVAMAMAERKAGSAVVMQNTRVVGIFTNVDGMTALADLLHTRLKA